MARGDLRQAEYHKGKGTQIFRNGASFPDSRRSSGNHGRLHKRGAGRFTISQNGEKHDPGRE